MSKKSSVYQKTELNPEQSDALKLFMLENGSGGQPDNVFREPDSAASAGVEQDGSSVPQLSSPQKDPKETTRQVLVRLPASVIKRLRKMKASGVVPYNFASLALIAAVNEAYAKNADAMKNWSED